VYGKSEGKILQGKIEVCGHITKVVMLWRILKLNYN